MCLAGKHTASGCMCLAKRLKHEWKLKCASGFGLGQCAWLLVGHPISIEAAGYDMWRRARHTTP